LSTRDPDARPDSTSRKGSNQIAAIAVISVLTAIGFWLRWSLATTGGYWRDEALALFVVNLPSWGAMIDFLRFHESHPPLFYALMRLWTSAVGDTDSMSILPSVLIGAAVIPAIFAIGRSLFSVRVGFVAAALATFLPALVEHAGTARPYSMLPLLTLVSVYALILATHESSARMWAGYVVSTIVLLYTHNWPWLILFGEWVAVAIFVAARSKGRGRLIRNWATVQGIIAAAYLPWLPTLLYQAKHAGHAPSEINIKSDFALGLVASARRFLESTIIAPVQLFSQQSYDTEAVLFAVPLLFLIAMQFLFARAATRHPVSGSHNGQLQTTAMGYLVIVPSAAFLAALAISPRTELMLARCLAAFAPLLLLAMGAWLGRARDRLQLTLGAATVAVFLATYVVSLAQLLPTSRSNARELAAAIGSRTQLSDLVVVSPDWLASSFNRYFEPGVEQIDYPEFQREGAINFADFLERFQNEAAMERVLLRFKTLREESRRVWLVNDFRKIRQRSPAQIRKLLSSKNYGLVSYARTAQLRLALDSLYGPPDTLRVTGGRVQRYEFFTALLYSPK
jgi:4-amino-4-deoxy-L-arabinose transferase-like glycosyltransferase